MKKFWVSWWHSSEDMGEFELHTPWWISGWREDGYASVVATVLANSEAAAEKIVRGSYDNKQVALSWRFCDEQPEDWTPFNSRFKRFPWMEWPEEG